MARYIDGDYIEQYLERWQNQLKATYGECDEYVLCLGEVLMKLDDTPTADVVEVVRCKDCKYWDTEWGVTVDGEHYCLLNDSFWRENWFCVGGERREECTQ